jgi:hypothetical protein
MVLKIYISFSIILVYFLPPLKQNISRPVHPFIPIDTSAVAMWNIFNIVVSKSYMYVKKLNARIYIYVCVCVCALSFLKLDSRISPCFAKGGVRPFTQLTTETVHVIMNNSIWSVGR